MQVIKDGNQDTETSSVVAKAAALLKDLNFVTAGHTYEADGHFVYYCNPETGGRELFLTVHPTRSVITEEGQAVVLTTLLNAIALGRFHFDTEPNESIRW